MTQIFTLQQSPQELSEQIRTSVEEQIRAAQADAQNPTRVVVSPDGKTVSIDRPGEDPARLTGSELKAIIRDMDVPPRAESLGYAFLLTFAAVIILGPISRAWARRINVRSEQPQVPAQVTTQLTQLSQAVDAIAIEVERISEGQRFTTKLLSEQQKAAKSLPSSS